MPPVASAYGTFPILLFSHEVGRAMDKSGNRPPSNRLLLGPDSFHAPSAMPLFDAIGDSAPDRWGRELIRRAERRRVGHEGRTSRPIIQVQWDDGMRRFEAVQPAKQEKLAEDEDKEKVR
jgi:hypothetical protein